MRMAEWIISSSVLIAVVITMRFALKGRISLRLQYALWALVLVRLLVPVSFGSTSISIMNQVEKSQVYQDATQPEINRPEINTPESVVPGPSVGVNTTPSTPNTETPPVIAPGIGSGEVITGNTQQSQQTTPVSPENPPVQEAPVDEAEDSIDWLRVLRYVWLGGSVLLGAWLLLTNLLFAVRLRKNRISLQTADKLPVYICDSVDTPCLFGFFRPAVYLTSDVASGERTMRHALEHEMTHYSHGDHIWAVLRCVCLAVHWYNPLVWCAAILSKVDAELACDESTIRRLGEDERAEYGRTLLRLTCEKRTSIMTTATTMTGSGKVIRERIALIVKKPKTALYTLIAVLVIAAVAIVCTFTGAEDQENETKLWPEDTVISCARFECADDGGYKLITSEIAQFGSLQHMNLIPVEGEFTGDVIYRLVLNWNEIAKNAEEYIILVSEECLSVNGQLYQPDGFDFSEILSYFEGKYRYFDYELLYDDNKDEDGESSGDEEIVDEVLAHVLHRIATLKPEDILSYGVRMQADAEILVPLIQAAAENYVRDYANDNMSEFSLDVHLTEVQDDPYHSPEGFTFNIDTREGIVDMHYRTDTLSEPSYHLSLRLYSTELWNYIFSLFNPDGIDLEALPRFEKILSERAQQTMENHNAICEAYNLPAFTGFEIRYLRLRDSFVRNGRVYQLYGWDVGFLTDDPDPGRYGWPQDGWVDSENRVILYEQAREFVAAWRHDDLEYEFFGDGFQYYSQLRVRASIIEHFTGEKLYLEGESSSYNSTIYTNNGISIEIPNQLLSVLDMHRDSDIWCDGMVMNPSYYFNLSHMNDQTLFSLFHLCEYWNSGGNSGLIFSIRRYNEYEYQTMYLNSYSRQQVFARDENYYYCVFIPTGTSSTVLEKLDTLNWYLDKILPDMIERNGWQAYDGEDDNNTQNDQPSDEEIRARALIKNFASLTAEDIKYIPGFKGANYSDVAVLLNDLGEYRIDPFESEASLWSMTIYLSGSEGNFSSKNDAWLSIYAYGEESRLQIVYHSQFGVYTHIYFDYPALHQYLREKFNTDDVVDADALNRYRGIIEARAEHTIAVRNSNFDTKFSGYEIVAFHQIASFERGGMAYTVYEWDVGFITDRNNINYPWSMNRVWVDSELRIRFYDSDPYFVVRTDGEKEEYDFFPWDTPLYGYDDELMLAYDEIAASFVPETDTRSFTEVSPGITVSEHLTTLPDAVISYAVDYVQTIVKHYNDLGAYSSDALYYIIEARITNIEQIQTGAVGLTDGINLYRLSYRLLADQPENITLAGGMTMEGNWLTEWSSTGQPYLLMRVDWSSGEDVWTRICVTNTDVIMTDYATPEMLERYGDPYLAASIELYHQFKNSN